MIKEESCTDLKEMYQVFNCGHRMELYVSSTIAQDIIAISKSFNINARIVGRVSPLTPEGGTSKRLTIQSEYGTFEY